jgi:hypothetical protein
MTRKPWVPLPLAALRCDDLNVVRAVRCQRDVAHQDLHRNGLFVWGAQDPWMPAWRRNLVAKDYTGRNVA